MRSKKHSCKNDTCSQHGVARQTDAVWLWKCDLGLPSSSFTEAVRTITVRGLSNRTSCIQYDFSKITRWYT
jgi:hypothetical protein